MQRTGYRFVSRGVRRSCRQSGSWRCRAVETTRHHGRPQVISRVGRRASFSFGQGPHRGWGHPVLCVCRGPDSTRHQAEIHSWWRRSASLIRSACLVSLPLVVLCDASARAGSVALAIRRRIGRIRLTRNFMPAPGPLSASHVARPAQ